MAHSRPSRPARIALILALPVLLAGCFTSSQPKFPLQDAVPALGDGGRYVTYERRDDGTFKRDEIIQMRPRAYRGYEYIDEKGKVTPLSMHPIGPDLYVAQAIREDGHNADYVVLKVNGGEVLSYTPDCTKQDAAKLKDLGVEIRDKGRICVIDAVDDPAGLFAGLPLGEPSGKMVRE